MAKMTRSELASVREWLASWGPVGTPNWCDKEGNSVPIAKTTLIALLQCAERGIEGYEQDAISHAEAHGVRGA